jgi:tRNA A58 N-methylase Trm61
MSLIKSQFQEHKEGWKKSSFDGFSQDENGNPIPWMTYPAIDFLKNNLQANHEVFEFGLGASTIFFANRVKHVTSLETNSKWLEIVKEKHALSNVDMVLMADGLINANYENFAKNSGKKFDFIIVDSLKRFECVKNSINALKKGGRLILDDSERENYKKIFEFLKSKNFAKQDFIGIAPGQVRVKNTTVFYKKKKRFFGFF